VHIVVAGGGLEPCARLGAVRRLRGSTGASPSAPFPPAVASRRSESARTRQAGSLQPVQFVVAGGGLEPCARLGAVRRLRGSTGASPSAPFPPAVASRRS